MGEPVDRNLWGELEPEEEEEEVLHVSYQVPKSATIVNCKGLVEKVLKTTILSQDWANRKNRSLEENVRSFYSGIAKVIFIQLESYN